MCTYNGVIVPTKGCGQACSAWMKSRSTGASSLARAAVRFKPDMNVDQVRVAAGVPLDHDTTCDFYTFRGEQSFGRGDGPIPPGHADSPDSTPR
jgi:hypothetical protein